MQVVWDTPIRNLRGFILSISDILLERITRDAMRVFCFLTPDNGDAVRAGTQNYERTAMGHN
jgi:hypothetical protein